MATNVTNEPSFTRNIFTVAGDKLILKCVLNDAIRTGPLSESDSLNRALSGSRLKNGNFNCFDWTMSCDIT